MTRTISLGRLGRLVLRCAPALLFACLATPAPAPVATPTLVVLRALRVLVSAPNGAGLEGARVCAVPTSGEERCADSGRDGAAGLALPAATYVVRVSGPSQPRYATAQRAVELFSGDLVVAVGLERQVRIGGAVRDQSGGPVALARACAYPGGAADPVCANSGADGAFLIEARAGVYRLDVSGPPGGRLVSQWARGRAFEEEADIIDARVADVTGVEVTLLRGVVLAGTVRLAGAAVERAQVCLKTLAAPLPWDCEITDRNGRYAALREPGRYWMWVVPPSGLRAVAQWYDRALVGVNARAYDLAADGIVDFALGSGPQIHGRVRTADGAPVVDALVCVDTPFTTGRICRPTGTDGAYAVTTRPEAYVVQVLPPQGSDLISEYWSGKRTWVDADEVRLGASDVDLDLVLQRGALVRGRVRDTRGVAVAGATLNLSDETGVVASAETDTAGAFEVAVSSGHYDVEVFPPFGAELVGDSSEVDARGSASLDVTLQDATP